MASLKKLAGETVMYGLSSILGRMLNYLLVIFYTKVFLPAEYGIVTDIYAYVAFLNILYTFGMETTYFRFANKANVTVGSIYNTAITSVAGVSLLLSAILILFSNQFAIWLEYPGKGEYISWMAITMAVDAFVAIPFARLRLEKRATKFVLVKLSNIFLVIFFNIFFLYFCAEVYAGHMLPGLKPAISYIYSPGMGVGYVFLANMLANLAQLLFFYKDLRGINPRINAQQFKPMLVYAYPLLLMGLSGTISEMLGRATLKFTLPVNFYGSISNQDALGIYGACYKLSVFMQLAIQAFKYAAEPFFFSQSAEKNSRQTFALVMRWFVIVCCGIFLAVSLNMDYIADLFMRREIYKTGLAVVPVLLMAAMFLGIYYNLTVWFKLSDKTYFGTWISLGGAVLTVVLNLALIPVWGYMGSAIATLAVYFLMAVACYALGQQHYPVPYPTLVILGYITLSVALVAVSRYMYIDNVWLYHGLNAVLLIVYAAAVYLAERDTLAPMLRRKAATTQVPVKKV